MDAAAAAALDVASGDAPRAAADDTVVATTWGELVARAEQELASARWLKTRLSRLALKMLF